LTILLNFLPLIKARWSPDEKKEAKKMEQYKKGLIKGIEKGPSRKDKVKYTGD
jgi:hypothetical protein